MQGSLQPQVAVAVISWNTREPLDRCLAALRPDAAAGLAEVWVVDNGSDDGSAAMVGERHAWARLIEPGENLGFGRAVNLVAERTGTPWLAAANADVEPRPGALGLLVEAGERRPRAGALAPRLIRPDGTLEHSVNHFWTVPLMALFNLGLYRLGGRRLAERLLLPGHLDPGRRRRVDWAVGAFLLCRRRAFDEAGGFDPAQWLYAEDVELGYRLREAGWQVWYEPAAEVVHVGEAAGSLAFGEGLTDRRLDATYALLRRRRGRPRTAAIYALNALGATARWLAWAPRRDPALRWRRHQMAALARYHLRRRR